MIYYDLCYHIKFKLFNSLIALFMVNVFFYKKRSVNRGTQNNTLSVQNNTNTLYIHTPAHDHLGGSLTMMISLVRTFL